MYLIRSRTKSDSNRSGDKYKNFTSPYTQLSSATSISRLLMPDTIDTAFIPFARRFSTWSLISAISGDTTMHNPSLAKAGTWKHTDFPPPVGSSASVSCPSNTDWMISCCIGRKASWFQYCLRICWMVMLW